MKKLRLFVLISFLMTVCKMANGQITFGNNPDAVFILNKAGTYQFNATAIPDDETYSLLVSRPGMTINSLSGLISWTPANLSDGGKAVIQVTNTGYNRTDTVYFFVSAGLQCQSGAISYWKFDALDNLSYPDEVDGHHAQSTPPEHPDDVTGVVDNAIKVTNVNQGLSIPDHTDFHFGSNKSFSISFWFKSNIGDRDATGVIIGRDEGFGYDKRHWWIGLDKDNQLFFLVRDKNYYDATFNDSVVYAHLYGDKFYNNLDWHHIVCVRDASSNKLKIYYDHGTYAPLTPNADIDYPGSSEFFGSTSTADLNVGHLSDNFQMDGTLDELLIFNRALTESEVISLYIKGNGGNPACDEGNAAPLFISEPDTIAFEDQAYSYQMMAIDYNVGDNLDYSPVNLPGWLSYNVSTHTISGTPVNDDVGEIIVKVKVSDGTSDVIQQYNLNVKNTNDAPQITSSPVLTVNEETAYSYDVDATDVDAGDVITYSLTQKPAWLSINSASGVISGTPALNDTGSYDVTVRATDVALAFAEQSYTLDIRNVNDAPAITGQNPNPLTVDEDNSLLIELANIVYTDVDNPSGDITLTVLSGNNYTFIGNTITPAENYSGSLSVNIQLSDLLANTAGAVAVTVNPVNEVPVITSTPVLAVNEDDPYIYNITYSDVDAGDVLTLSAVTIPSWLQLNAGQGTLTGTPTNDQVGVNPTATFMVKIKVSDGSLDSTQTFYVTVTNINDAPEITGQKDTLQAEPNGSVTLQLSNINVADVDDLTADLTLTVLPGSNYTIAGNTVIISSDAGTGLLPVNIRVSDPDNAKDEGVYQVRVLTTGIEDMQYTASLVHKVYPTPAAEYVVFEFNPANKTILRIMDITGKLVIEKPVGFNNQTISINISQLPEGIYFFRASSENRYQTGKFTILHK